MVQIKDLDSRALILAFFAFFVDFLRNVVRNMLVINLKYVGHKPHIHLGGGRKNHFFLGYMALLE